MGDPSKHLTDYNTWIIYILGECSMPRAVYRVSSFVTPRALSVGVASATILKRCVFSWLILGQAIFQAAVEAGLREGVSPGTATALAAEAVDRVIKESEGSTLSPTATRQVRFNVPSMSSNCIETFAGVSWTMDVLGVGLGRHISRIFPP